MPLRFPYHRGHGERTIDDLIDMQARRVAELQAKIKRGGRTALLDGTLEQLRAAERELARLQARKKGY